MSSKKVLRDNMTENNSSGGSTYSVPSDALDLANAMDQVENQLEYVEQPLSRRIKSLVRVCDEDLTYQLIL